MNSKAGQPIRLRGGSKMADKLIKAMESTLVKEEFMFGDVCVTTTRDHILSSQCHHSEGVSNYEELCQIGPSKNWQRSRSDVNRLQRGSRPFDWTYTSDYKGTVEGYTVVPTNETISVEKLKRRDPISFYSQLILYEDELADHGCSEMSIRLRAMPTCLFLLCRFYLRIDDVLVRICDTRLYKELNSDTFLRQWTRRELKLDNSSPSIRNNILDPDIIYDCLPIIEEEMTKLIPLRCCT